MRQTKTEMIDFTRQNFEYFDIEHNLLANMPALTTKFQVLNLYRRFLQAVTNYDPKDFDCIVKDDIILGYQVETSCDDQTQPFVNVDCTGINVDGERCRYLWKAMTMCQFLKTH
jgi:hypothetical protein